MSSKGKSDGWSRGRLGCVDSCSAPFRSDFESRFGLTLNVEGEVAFGNASVCGGRLGWVYFCIEGWWCQLEVGAPCRGGLVWSLVGGLRLASIHAPLLALADAVI